MKFAAIILALLCPAIGGFSADTRAPRVDRVWLAGKEYVRLDQWARANSFQLRWLGKNDLMVSSATTRMNFTAESRRMLLNGITVLLSEPIRAQPLRTSPVRESGKRFFGIGGRITSPVILSRRLS